MNFLSYWDKYVKLSLNFIPYDNNGRVINKESFLKKLTTGEYLPLRMKPDTVLIYKLFKIDTGIYHGISVDISASAMQHLHYFQMIGKPFPSFSFVDLNGNIFNQKTCKGKIVVINTWFIHCQACIEEAFSYLFFIKRLSTKVTKAIISF
jgi:hypothetical protein